LPEDDRVAALLKQVAKESKQNKKHTNDNDKIDNDAIEQLLKQVRLFSVGTVFFLFFFLLNHFVTGIFKDRFWFEKEIFK
jgi:hypothetical protein